jgi:hypothetical protein
MLLATAEAFYRAFWWDIVVLGNEKVLGLIIKLWLMFKSHHLVLWFTRNLWSIRVWVRNWLCKGKTHHRPPVHPTKGKLHCCLTVILCRVSIRWSFLRFKADLPSQKSLYLIRWSPNCSKVKILTSYLFTSYIFNTWGCTLSCNFTLHRY